MCDDAGSPPGSSASTNTRPPAGVSTNANPPARVATNTRPPASVSTDANESETGVERSRLASFAGRFDVRSERREREPRQCSPSSRRRFLTGLAGAGAAVLAGCTEDVGEEFPPNIQYPIAEYRPALPVEERLSVVAERIEATADAGIQTLEEFVTALEGYAVEVHSIDRDRDVLVVDYENLDTYDEGNLHGVGLVAGAFAAYVAAGFDGEAVEITILDAAPATYGVAEVETRWADAYNGGDLTATEYGELVAGTVESTRHEPEVEVETGE